jgi:hypothetical protein
VAAPVTVAALVNRNDAVTLIDAVNEHATCSVVADIAGMLHQRAIECSRSSSTRERRTPSITFTTSFLFTSAARLTGAATAKPTITAAIRSGVRASAPLHQHRLPLALLQEGFARDRE